MHVPDDKNREQLDNANIVRCVSIQNSSPVSLAAVELAMAEACGVTVLTGMWCGQGHGSMA